MKICIVTGTRAEYGLLKPLIDELIKHSSFTTQLLVTGSHLSPEFGLTYRQIEQDGLKIDYKVEMLLSSDTAEGISKSMGIGMIGFADAFKNLQPDLLVILGDRYEMLAIASTALIFKIPIAHIHGGEITEGAYDDAIRHAITKISHLHFASTDLYRNRIIQMGEQPETVFNVGAIGLDNIINITLLGREELEKQLNVKFKTYNYLISFHSETLSNESAQKQFNNVLMSIDQMEDSFFVFTKSNADTNGRIINQLMEIYVKQNTEKAALFDSLGTLRYLSVIKHCTALVGNSSSGILEAPALNTPTINIGDRQKGRIHPISVMNCENDTKQITKLLHVVQNTNFVTKLFTEKNPYGNGGVGKRIAEIISQTKIDMLKMKKFYNVNYK